MVSANVYFESEQTITEVLNAQDLNDATGQYDNVASLYGKTANLAFVAEKVQ